jgi:alpha-N-arabinofuranosidase
MKKILLLTAAAAFFLQNATAQTIDVKSTEDFSPYVFGHNLEHTRAAVNGGLSAQMLRNRKFAGKPSKNEGVAADWKGIGEKVFFLTNRRGYTKHIGNPGMDRGNELNCQSVQNLKEGQIAGICQDGISVKGCRTYLMRTVTRVNVPVTLRIDITGHEGNRLLASKTLSLTPSEDFVSNEFELTPSSNDFAACVKYTFEEKAEVVFGALSMMPKDNFHGMRSDVVANLKAIGPRIIRWPGGNFAGEYRWKDGLLPVDQRGPLQASMEIETQPYTYGYDFHEIDTDDFIALCREVGAEPMLTINIAWNTPEESAQWVEYCNGPKDTEYGRIRAERGHPEPYNVLFWSLGNEMGYGHMEGPNGAEGYSSLAEKHADAMLKVTPDLNLCSSGPYPNDDWAVNSAARLAEKVKYISLHHYASGTRSFTTAEDEKKAYESTVRSFEGNIKQARLMRESLDKTGESLHISFDEWNQWYAWYRPSCVTEGIYAARTLHFYLNESNSLDMPIVCYFQPVGEGAIEITPDGSRLTAIGQMFAMMKAHQDGRLCKVSDNEDYSTAASVKEGILTVTLVNASYDENREFSFALKGKVLDAKLFTSDDVTPHTYFEESPLQVNARKKDISVVLPPHSAAIVRLTLGKK